MNDDSNLKSEDSQLDQMPLPGEPSNELADQTPTPLKKKLLELMLVSLKIGSTSFGAPTAHIAMMEDEYVRKRKWVTPEHFLDLLAAANLIPGPNASETCYHVGYVRAGYPGLLVAGFSFILPAFIASMILSWVYVRFGSLPELEGLFYFLNPLVLSIVLVTTWRIGKSSLIGWEQFVLFGLALVGKLVDLNEVLIMLGCGALAVLLHYGIKQKLKTPPNLLLSFAPLPFMVMGLKLMFETISERAWQIFWYFLRTGSVLFGSSLVLFALIEEDVVNRFGWLTTQQLTDAIAVGQITPGPVLSSSTFVGFLAGGFWGGVASTVGVFLPSFIIVAITAPLVKKMRENAITSAFLKGVNAAVVALILMVCVGLARNALVDVGTGVILLAGFLAMLLLKAPPYMLVLAGLAMGLIKALVK
ncbi:MAG TPA: chromate efflux transporter [Anaerolineaceae bacterium]|nr:chromate efflux transporter [Anaerolineaceae bacterium]